MNQYLKTLRIDLPDPRSAINRIHLLEDIIVISILAVIAGAAGPKAIGIWTATPSQWLRDKLRLPDGIPSRDTIGRVLITLKPEAFQRRIDADGRRGRSNKIAA